MEARRSCQELKTFAYLITSDALDQIRNYKLMIGKLLLSTNNIGLSLIDTNEVGIFQAGNFFVFDSDNVFRKIFEFYLARLVEAGISLVQKRYMTEINSKRFVEKYKRKYDVNLITNNNLVIWNNIDKDKLASDVTLWLHNGCFSYYTKEKCNLKFGNDSKVIITFADLLSLWVLFSGLLVTSIFVLGYEHLQFHYNVFVGFEVTWN